MPLTESSGDLLALPGWWPEAMLWLGLAILAAVVVVAAGAWSVARRLDRLRTDLRALDTLEEMQRAITRWMGAREDLDLRRIEHLLIDLRDGSRRLEEVILRSEERRAVSNNELLLPAVVPGLGERIVNRLVALGFERVELVTPHQELESMASSGGEVVVEGRRDGVLHKGRVRIRGGRIDAVQLQPAYSVFP